jgi:quinol-cytochrome oxidoreductase complex cytochrome b subunit
VAEETVIESPKAEDPPAPRTDAGENGAGNGRLAATVSVRPSAPPADLPEGVRHQRLLTVVKARAIQQVKADPTDKVNTWPHLMITEFTALLAMTAFLLVLSVILQAPLLEAANFNATPNPSKAPWYFLGLQEMLSYFDPQIAGVTVPTVIGIVGFMMIPYIDRNPSTRPSDRKLAIMLYTIFLTGSATLTILGVLFRGPGFNFAYPWIDGVFFDDLKDWVDFGGH